MKELKKMSLEYLERQIIVSLTSWGNLDGQNALNELFRRFAEKDEKIRELEESQKMNIEKANKILFEKFSEYFEVNQWTSESGFADPLSFYVHEIWKRDPKVSELQQQVEDLKRETGVLITCRDHWKTSYETLNKLLHGEKECKKCHGIGYTIFYEHKSYPVPHENKHAFLCNCLSNNLLNFIKKER